jgi:hypothetical protein
LWTRRVAHFFTRAGGSVFRRRQRTCVRSSARSRLSMFG